MARYFLVGSYYNRDNNSYSREVEILTLDGVNLSSLARIDFLTSGLSFSSILEKIECELGIVGLNHLSIRYGKSNPSYYRIIDNNVEFNRCVSSVKVVRVTVLGNTRDMLLVDKDDLLYKGEKSKMLEVISSKDIDVFKTIYKHNDSFSRLVERYMSASYDNDIFEEEALREIDTCFRCYSIFRKWFVGFSKYERKRASFVAPRIKCKSDYEKEFFVRQDLGVRSIEEHEELYKKNYEDKYGVSYDGAMASCYNQRYDEYLSAEEYAKMFGEDSCDVGERGSVSKARRLNNKIVSNSYEEN